MNSRQRKAARTRESVSDQAGSSSLLGLPVEVLHQVLDVLGPHNLVQLLQTSKAMAKEVMQHSAGRLTLRVAYKGVKWAVIRQLLQWAPPSSLKLWLQDVVGRPGHPGYMDAARFGFSRFSQLFNVPYSTLPAHDSNQDHQMQQLPCILEVCIQGFTLQSVVPAGLAALCPNMHTLRLIQVVVDGSDYTGCNSMSSICPATSVHTLILEACTVAGLVDLPSSRSTVKGHVQPAVPLAEQLRSSVPNMTCLKLQDYPVPRHFIAMLGPQLAELHLLLKRDSSFDLYWPTVDMHLQYLQKLMLPQIVIATAADVKELLNLPSVTHLEINTLGSDFTEDYSNHPCKWQHLHIHVDTDEEGLWLDSLARLPLHSLKHPLTLGFNKDAQSVLLCLPRSYEDGMLPRLERLAQQLTKCGVNLLAAGVAWDSGDAMLIYATYCQQAQGAEQVPAFMAIAPVFGLYAHVALTYILIDPPILEALATVYGSSLKHLTFHCCQFEEDTLPVWQAALSGLPAMDRVDLTNCSHLRHDHDDRRTTNFVQPLAEAMSQQPAGRCIEVAPDECADRVKEFAAAQELAGVEVTAMETTAKDGGVGMCWHITSKHML